LTISKNLCALQIETSSDFKKNLEKFSLLVEKLPLYSMIAVPEVCLSGFEYDRFEECADFSEKAIPTILELSKNKTILLTLIEKEKNDFYNNAKIFHNEKIIYSQPKVKLFKYGNEDRYFTAGKLDDIKIIEIEGIKISIIICFELRFIEIWEKCKGSDIIFVLARWGKERKTHLQKLSQALALINQCFVVVSNSRDDEMAKSSAIIHPDGRCFVDDRKRVIQKICNLKEIKIFRKYMDIGL